VPSSPCKAAYAAAQTGEKLESKILAFKNKAPAPKDGYQNHLKVLYTQNKTTAPEAAPTRSIPLMPARVLDAPDLTDDYYLNLLDWSSTNMLAIGLANTVYLWNASTGDIHKLMQLAGAEDIITSVSWTADGRAVAVGTKSAAVQLWDVERLSKMRTLAGHQSRGTCFASITTMSYIYFSRLARLERPVAQQWQLGYSNLQLGCACGTAPAVRLRRPHSGGMRAALVARRHAPGVRRQRQPR
jgi:hypothetical protein